MARGSTRIVLLFLILAVWVGAQGCATLPEVRDFYLPGRRTEVPQILAPNGMPLGGSRVEEILKNTGGAENLEAPRRSSPSSPELFSTAGERGK